MKTLNITPEINAQILETANKKCIENNDFTRKFFNRAFDRAIKNAGYNVKEYHNHAKLYF